MAFALTALSAAAAICAAALLITPSCERIPLAKPLLIYAPALYARPLPLLSADITRLIAERAAETALFSPLFIPLVKPLPSFNPVLLALLAALFIAAITLLIALLALLASEINSLPTIFVDV